MRPASTNACEQSGRSDTETGLDNRNVGWNLELIAERPELKLKTEKPEIRIERDWKLTAERYPDKRMILNWYDWRLQQTLELMMGRTGACNRITGARSRRKTGAQL